MKTKFKISLAFLLLGTISNAQHTVILKNATPLTSATQGGGNSVVIGDGAGNALANSAGQNTFVGFISGMENTTATDNTFIGWGTGSGNKTGAYNTFIGRSTGGSNVAGHTNTYLGAMAGLYATGSGNVFLGFESGRNELGSNKLYIANGQTATPLIWGDFADSRLKFHAKVAIGGNVSTAFGNFPTTAGGVNVSNYNLFVKGGILTDEIRVALSSTWADYVFAKDYKLPTIKEVEDFIENNGHLPNVPSAAQVKEEGIELGEMAKIQQEKIEELMLYIIQQNKRIEALEAKLNTKQP